MIDPELASPTTPETPERLVEELAEKLNREIRYREGAENLLQVLDLKKDKDAKVAKNRAKEELNTTNYKIALLKKEMEAIKKPKEPSVTIRAAEPIQPPINGSLLNFALEAPEVATESPTFTLSEVLQSLEEKGRRPEFYVEKANTLALLFKRHPTLKHDLVWAEFGQRVQSMLLHENKEVVAAGYRITRYAITGIDTLKTIRKLQTDYITIWYVSL